MNISNFLYRMFCSIALLHLTACATGTHKNFIEDGRTLIKSGNWDAAYRSIEDGLGSSDSNIRLAVYDLIASHPELKFAASKSFDDVVLTKTFTAFDPSSAKAIEENRLHLYEKFATDVDFKNAKTNVNAAYAKANILYTTSIKERRKKGFWLIVSNATLDQIAVDEVEKIKQTYPMMRVISNNSIGKITSQQILDKSKPGSNFGSQLGSAISQSAYIDKSFSQQNYAVLGQLSAGLIGAVVGSALNQNAEARFSINYGVQFNDGSVRSIVINSTEALASPIGQCVYSLNIEEAPNYLCNDSILKFYARIKGTSSLE